MTTDTNRGMEAEVVVIGGGLAGLTMACALGSAQIPTISLDRDDPEVQRSPDFDLRTTAIAFGSQRILDGVGLWQHLSDGAEPILEIRVADDHAPVFVHYDHRAIGSDPFGWIVDNATIRRGLFHRLLELPSVTHLAPATVASIDRHAAHALVTLQDGRQIRARLVIGADGRGSLARRSAGIDVMQWPYHQTAIVCTIGHERPHNGVAIEHFLPGGPFAVLPMTRNRSSIVWSERSSLVPMFLNLSDAAFLSELQHRTGDHLGALHVIGGRASYPLSILLAQDQTAHRLALIGEAAHAIHPVAGQGLNMGLRDVAALAEVIVDQARLGLDVGDPEVLSRYERWRRFDNLSLALVCDSLVRLFSNRILPVRLARDSGLGLVNQIPTLKAFFMRHAMGLVGDLPRLVRGEPL